MRILVVEDDQSLRESLASTLAYEAWTVDTAADGDTASSLACNNDYDMVILDYNLPRKNGRDVCSYIRSQGRTMPILVLSVVKEIDIKVTILNLGADDYLTKPFSTEELIARIKALRRRPNQVTNPILKIDDLVIDTERQIVRRGKYGIDLPRKQYVLLVYFFNHQDQLITRRQIVENIWDANVDPMSNALEAHICELRKRLDVGSRRKLIHTIQGRGYRFGLRS